MKTVLLLFFIISIPLFGQKIRRFSEYIEEGRQSIVVIGARADVFKAVETYLKTQDIITVVDDIELKELEANKEYYFEMYVKTNKDSLQCDCIVMPKYGIDATDFEWHRKKVRNNRFPEATKEYIYFMPLNNRSVRVSSRISITTNDIESYGEKETTCRITDFNKGLFQYLKTNFKTKKDKE